MFQGVETAASGVLCAQMLRAASRPKQRRVPGSSRLPPELGASTLAWRNVAKAQVSNRLARQAFVFSDLDDPLGRNRQGFYGVKSARHAWRHHRTWQRSPASIEASRRNRNANGDLPFRRRSTSDPTTSRIWSSTNPVASRSATHCVRTRSCKLANHPFASASPVDHYLEGRCCADQGVRRPPHLRKFLSV